MLSEDVVRQILTWIDSGGFSRALFVTPVGDAGREPEKERLLPGIGLFEKVIEALVGRGHGVVAVVVGPRFDFPGAPALGFVPAGDVAVVAEEVDQTIVFDREGSRYFA